MHCKLVNKKVVPCSMEEWAQAFEKESRIVARTELTPEVTVSTVFLGLDHSFGSGTPLWFETMVFRDGADIDQQRYTTWEEAELGHMEMVEALQAKLGVEIIV